MKLPKRFDIPQKDIVAYLKTVEVAGPDAPRPLTGDEIKFALNHWNVMVEHSRRRIEQIFKKHIVKARPFIRFLGVADSGMCDFCKSMHGVIVRYDDSRINNFFPPFHFGCRCLIVTTSERQIKREGWVISTLDGIPDPTPFNFTFL